MYIVVKCISERSINGKFSANVFLVLADYSSIFPDSSVGYRSSFLFAAFDNETDSSPIVIYSLDTAEQTRRKHELKYSLERLTPSTNVEFRVYNVDDYLEEAVINRLKSKDYHYQMTERLQRIVEENVYHSL